ncbi:XVIPCD domain-containing protein [Luteibacter sp. CQ10]|uniref:XVIPCD domain-containing protein n=1 Tax=Luteibacter sp. CQ10 TaxID=2805821 RepID=UPI0034A2F906
MAIDREMQVLDAAYAEGIRSPRELANFMAQVTHESNGLNRLEESFRYMRGIAQIPTQAAWREGPQVLEAARKEALLGRPERLAELMYGERNGNDQPGDGLRYRGRGYLPVPGKSHYRAAGLALGIDLVSQPDLAAEPAHAARIAAWYWRNHVPPAAREDVRHATQALNGKLYGLDDRRERFETWQSRLSPQLMQRLHDEHRDPSARDADSHAETARPAADVAIRRTDEGRRKKKVDDDPSATPSAADTADDIDPVLMYELQRDVMEATTEYVAVPERPHHRHRHHPSHLVASPPPTLHQPTHPRHALFNQALDAVQRLDKDHRRDSDERSERLAAALTVAAHHKGMERIDHVALNDDATRIFAVQGDLHSPHKQVAEVNTAHAIETPMERSAMILALNRPSPTPEQGSEPQHAVKSVPGP